jgi:hypothetical protein
MPGGNAFDKQLVWDPVEQVVVATGPVDDRTYRFDEMTIFIVQRHAGQDAVAAELAESSNEKMPELGKFFVKGGRFVCKAGLRPEVKGPKDRPVPDRGPAYAQALAVVTEKKTGKQAVLQWGEPVELVAPPKRKQTASAQKSTAPKSTPRRSSSPTA